MEHEVNDWVVRFQFSSVFPSWLLGHHVED